MKLKILDTTGKEKGSYELPKDIFELPWNADLVHQVIVSMQSNRRQGTAHAKDRSEVRGGGKKPWRQKGTGRSRHGSIRSPIWIGGGVTHGPRNEKNFKKKINKKMKRKALYTILSQKARDKELILLSDLPKEPKTKEAVKLLDNLSKLKDFEKISYEKGRRVIIYSPEHNKDIVKMFSNIKSAHIEEARNANPLQVATYKYVIIVDPNNSIKKISNIKEEKKATINKDKIIKE